MIIPQELLVLLPCHSLEDFPQHHEGEQAAGLLAGWTALWHPRLLTAAGRAPAWYRADDPPQEPGQRLIVVPAVSHPLLPSGFLARAEEAGACVIQRATDREQILSQAFHACSCPGDVDSELAADFIALGYCYLQTQLLTRQMRYSSNLDEVHFFEQLLAGAQAAVGGDAPLARQQLAACFDLLAEERDHYYSVDAYLLDITLLAEHTLGEALRDQLRDGHPSNLLISGELLEKLAQREPDTLEIVRAALGEERLGLIGGEWSQEPLPLQSPEALLAQLQRGAEAYRQYAGGPVEVFGRWRFGVTPLLPQVLEKLHFLGAIHAHFEQGRYPEGTQAKTRWEGWDGAAVDALAKAPLDAARPETFLSLAQRLGESMDMDHVATLCLAHWPGQVSPWYEDLRRCARYGAALGKLVTVTAYFRDTYAPGHLDRFSADLYRSPYLTQAMRQSLPDPLSGTAGHWQRQGHLDLLQGLRLLVASLAPSAPDAPPAGPADPQVSIEDLRTQIETTCRAFADALPRRSAASQKGILVINPTSFPRRMRIDCSALAGLPDRARPVYAAGGQPESWAMVDVPAMGFHWLTAGDGSADSRKAGPLLGEDLRRKAGVLLLRNEFFEATIDPEKGALAALKDYEGRTNRLGQQLAMRKPRSRAAGGDRTEEQAEDSQMGADEVTLSRATPLVAEVQARGRLLDRAGERLADFEQSWRVWRGSRVLELDIRLDPIHELHVSPWNEYLACRFAWADETSTLARSLQCTRQHTEAPRCEAPLFYEISSAERRTTIFPYGWPYARRVGFRMLDYLLIVHGEEERNFRFGIGVDVPNPVHEAIDRMSPATAVFQEAPPPKPASTGWLFHLDSRAAWVSWWEPVLEEGQMRGARLRVLETLGQAIRTRLACFRPVTQARRLDFQGESLGDCPLDEGRAVLELAAHEWSQFEVRWDESPAVV